MKYSKLEEQIREEKNIFRKHDLIMQITEGDEICGNLTKKVIKKDVANMLEKILGIYQRENCDCKDISDMSEIRQLISWLEYICED